MEAVNPYEPPRVPGAPLIRRGWFALPRVFPKYGVERILVTVPLQLGLFLASGACLGGLTRKMYSFATLDGQIVTYVKPPNWDEAAWACGTLLSIALFLVILVLHVMRLGRPRAASERWVTSSAVFLCFLPALLSAVADERPWHRLGPGYVDLFALIIGLGLVSAALQTWNWLNRRQPGWFMASAYFSLNERWQRLFGGAGHRRPGRP